MTDHQAFQPSWASHPGETITDVLRERSLSINEFSQRFGVPRRVIEDLLHGRIEITLAMARQLHSIVGGSVEFWMSRDFQYRRDRARLRATEGEWLAALPLRDMIKFGWINTERLTELRACLAFFGVANIRAWQEKYADVHQMAAFRTSPSYDSRPAAVAVWLRQGERQAEAITCNPWDASAFQESLRQLRQLTREKDPRRFLPRLQELCAENGVAVVVVRAPNGCRASGATRFMALDKALLQLSFRYLNDDHFWFTLFHEAGHLLLHGATRLFLESPDTAATNEEQQANDFAARMLVPEEFRQELIRLPSEARKVIRFARKVGVSPGIVVGQLQHHGRVRRDHLNRLKRRFRWND